MLTFPKLSEFDQICRTCLMKKENMLPIHTKMFIKMFQACIKVKIKKSDRLPKLICVECSNDLQKSFNFKYLCENSEKVLLQILRGKYPKMVKRKKHEHNKLVLSTDSIKKEKLRTLQNNTTTQDLMMSEGIKYEMTEHFSYIEDIPLSDRFFLNANNIFENKTISTDLKFNIKKEGDNLTDSNFKTILSNRTPETNNINRSKIFTDIENNESITDYNKRNENIECMHSISVNEKLHDISQVMVRYKIGDGVNNKSEVHMNGQKSEKIHKVLEYKENIISTQDHQLKLENSFQRDESIFDHVESDEENLEKSEHVINMFRLNSIEISDKKETTNHLRIQKVLMMSADKCDPLTLTCKICNKSLVNISSLGRHMELHDEDRKFNYNCDTCGKGFYEKSQLTKHERRHKNETRYECDKCNKRFYELSALAVHVKKHGIKPTSCNICGKHFYLKLQLDTHMKTHSDDKLHSCEKCGRAYSLASQLRRHLVTHDKCPKFPCLLCDKSFKYAYTLKKHHSNVHSANEDIPKLCICNVCGKSVKHLSAHMLVHGGERTFKCLHCPRAFFYRSQLDAHIRTRHAELINGEVIRQAAYLCAECGKCCQTKTQLSVHARGHTGERPFACHMCNKAYTTNYILTLHLRSHAEHRPYVCTVCRKGFYTCNMLTRHSRIHTGERPYVCQLCGRAFNQSSALRTHMKIH